MHGQTISHYQIIRTLGHGGMGDVLLAEDIRLRRPVALKILRHRSDVPEEERRRLLREARIASALSHPNIAVIYDVDEVETPEGPVHLLAMEYVPGQTLAEVVQAGSLGLEEILDMVGQICDALAEAHARGVVHRDLKPANVMVASGRVKVLDFGLAQVREPSSAPLDEATWSRGAVVEAERDGLTGTPHYMSPEQYLGHPVDARSDIFSLGILFYELIAGRRPFGGENVMQIAHAIIAEEPSPLPPRMADARIPEIERLIRRMLAKDAAARPADLHEVCAAIARLRAPAPVLLPTSGTLTVAIAGFANLTRRGEDEWLGTGLSETVTAALQEIEGIEVWGRERLRESLRRLGLEAGELQPEDAVQVGRAAGSRWILAGGYQRQGDSVRVTARVVEVASGRVVRAIRQDGTIAEIFALQDRIVADLSAGLRRSVAAAQEGDDTHVIGAYEALAKGLLNVRADSYESLERGILHFERALALDPDYVRALVELGAAYTQKGDYLAAPELYDRATALIRRALELRPMLPRAWRELGKTQVAQGMIDAGLESLRRALSLAPDDPVILAGIGRGYFIGTADFPRAAEMYARAVERNPQAGWYWLQYAHVLALLRDFDRCEEATTRAIELQDAYISGQQGIMIVGAHMRRGHLRALQGRHAEALDALEGELAFVEHLDHALRSRIRIELHMRLGSSLRAVGRTAEADASFATAIESFEQRLALGADEPYTRYYAAATHVMRGEDDDGLGLLEHSVRESRAFMVARARIEPEWEAVRGDPRFQRLLGDAPASAAPASSPSA